MMMMLMCVVAAIMGGNPTITSFGVTSFTVDAVTWGTLGCLSEEETI